VLTERSFKLPSFVVKKWTSKIDPWELLNGIKIDKSLTRIQKLDKFCQHTDRISEFVYLLKGKLSISDYSFLMSKLYKIDSKYLLAWIFICLEECND